MADRFQLGLSFVLKWEGGYSNDPADPGGATNLGIIQSEYDVYRLHKGLSKQSVRKITEVEAREIYHNSYWGMMACGHKPAPLDIVLFDTSVNMGVQTAIKMLQRLLGVTPDGDFGPHSIAALAAVRDVHALSETFLQNRVIRYNQIVANRPSLAKFLKGWINRVQALRVYISHNATSQSVEEPEMHGKAYSDEPLLP